MKFIGFWHWHGLLNIEILESQITAMSLRGRNRKVFNRIVYIWGRRTLVWEEDNYKGFNRIVYAWGRRALVLLIEPPEPCRD
jgi:hypothetical protein